MVLYRGRKVRLSSQHLNIAYSAFILLRAMDRTVTALKNSEEEIVRGFSGDPRNFIRKCTEIGIYSRAIGGSIKKSFEALDLDSSVPRDVSIRYLLVHAYDGVRGKQRHFEPFLNVLGNYGVTAELMHKVTQSHTLVGDLLSTGGTNCSKRLRNNFFLERHVSALTEILAGQSSSWNNIGISLNLPSNILKDILSLLYTGDSKMCLNNVLQHWIVRLHEHAKAPTVENLKTALRSNTVGLGGMANQLDDELTKHGICLDDASLAKKPRFTAKTATVENLAVAQRINQLDDDVICLDDEDPSSLASLNAKASVENIKIAQRSSAANQLDDDVICLDDEDPSLLTSLNAKASVENLKVAQRSSMANQLDDDVICLDDEVPSSVSLAKRPRLDSPLLDLVSQSLDTSVQKDKSTLLEVQVEARHGTTISYQWLKDDLPLEEGEDFIGINKPILCINNSCIAKGAYVCKITSEDDLTPDVYSEHINVSVSIPPLKKVLVERYCAQPEIPEDSWPPRGGNTYINLALIKQGSIEKAGEYARNTIQGDMDDIFANKDSIEYEDVFTNLESGTRLLIEGRGVVLYT